MKTKLVWIRSKPKLLLVIAIALASIAVRALLSSSFGASALLYIAVPFLITLGLLQADLREYAHWTGRYLRAFRSTFVVLFAVSIVLYEGIVCVLMFLPIYLIVTLLAMLAEGIWRAAKRRSNGTAGAYALPVIVLFASLEGTSTGLTFDRFNEVSVTRAVDLPLAELRANIGRPFDLRKDRPGFLEIFPMPEGTGPKAMSPGEVHEIHFTYHRWLVTNTHHGRMLLEMTEVSSNHVTTTILEDTSYISHYLKLHGTRIDLEPIDAATTEITLTVRFDRKLDPAWYFGPLERYGVSKMADFLIEEVIVR